jgi:hypothetical protein
MKRLDFVLWLLGFPLILDISIYLNGDVVSNDSNILRIMIWILIAGLLWYDKR